MKWKRKCSNGFCVCFSGCFGLDSGESGWFRGGFGVVSGWFRGGFGVVSGWFRGGFGWFRGGFGWVRVGSGGFGWVRVGSGGFGWVRVGSGGFGWVGWVRVIPAFIKYEYLVCFSTSYCDIGSGPVLLITNWQRCSVRRWDVGGIFVWSGRRCRFPFFLLHCLHHYHHHMWCHLRWSSLCYLRRYPYGHKANYWMDTSNLNCSVDKQAEVFVFIDSWDSLVSK